jgi:hypothetical protein
VPEEEYLLYWNDEIYDASYRTFKDGGDLYTSNWTLYNSPYSINDSGDQIGFVFKRKDNGVIDLSELSEMEVEFTLPSSYIKTINEIESKTIELENKIDKIVLPSGAGNPNIVSTLNFEGSDTQKIQRALDHLESVGGGILQLEPRTYEICMADSIHSKACVIVPKNVHIRGCGIDATIIKRLPSERGVDGILFVNKNHEIKDGFTADGNIMYSDFTITDGAATPNRAWGDLIAVTHSHDTIIERVKSLNHDQHFVDISGSYNTIVRDCISHNEVDASGSAIYQIDFGSGIWGTAGFGPNPSEKVLIENCIITDSRAQNVFHYHNNVSCKDVVINNCYVNITGTASINVIGTDSNSVPNSLTISNNRFYINNPNARVINIIAPNAKDIFIQNNIIKGTAEGINVSSSGGSNICIEHNNIDLTTMAITVANANDVSLIFNKIKDKNNKYSVYGVTAMKKFDEDDLQ